AAVSRKEGLSLGEWLRWLTDVEALIRWGGLTGIVTIVFIETGLFIGFFLPGDSLLVTAGIMAAAGYLDLRWLIPLTILAAIIGDQVNYAIGYRAGVALMSRYERFRPHLERAHAFYEKHGAKTIVLARFVPIVRTFAPAVAGAARMNYRTFVTYNIVGGIVWVLSTTLTGYFLGRAIPHIDRYLHLVIAIVVFLSILPILREWRRERRKERVSHPT
ncbi:MAG: VTT domain-containing protein, partial [Armatimonadota bacterium]|nr:VTT domain-containing protein [Armatimonadota bacterium]